MRLHIIIFTVLLAMLMPRPISAAAPADNDQPNILFILVDDMGYGDLSCYGSTQISTPHIDSLAQHGVRFTQAYVSAPVCAPSRAGILTGRCQQRFGFEHNLSVPEHVKPRWVGLPTNETTMADRLRALGYRTGAIGKWHLGDRNEAMRPNQRGFDSFFGFLGGSHPYHLQADTHKLLRDEAPLTTLRTPYLTDLLTLEAMDFITRTTDAETSTTVADREPWFLYLAYNTPHTPMQARDDDLVEFAHITNEKRRTYCAMQRNLDDNVGRLIDSLRASDQLADTLIVFLNDNGGTPTTNAGINAPLRGMKGTFLEGGLRVPMIMQWPGTLPEQAMYNQPVSSLDLMHTFVAAAGGSIEPELIGRGNNQTLRIYDGVNLLPFIRGEQPDDDRPHDVLYWRMALRGAAMRDGDWKLIRTPFLPPMLFNLAQDVSELNDLALEHPERVRDMMHALHRWEATFERNPMWISEVFWGTYNERHYSREYQLTQPTLGPGDDTPARREARR